MPTGPYYCWSILLPNYLSDIWCVAHDDVFLKGRINIYSIHLIFPIESTRYNPGLSISGCPGCMYSLLWITLCPLCVLDRQVQLERGDSAAQELVNSLQVLEVMAGAMAAELKPLVRLLSPASSPPLMSSLIWIKSNCPIWRLVQVLKQYPLKPDFPERFTNAS